MTDEERAQRCLDFVRRLATWTGEISGTCMAETMAEARQILGLHALQPWGKILEEAQNRSRSIERGV